MKFIKQLFDWMLVIGIILMVGRIITLICMKLDIPFTAFFKDYSTISVIILLIGVLGQSMMKGIKN
ncbi:MAG: hypothetical protein ACI35O_15145 [Bacillaceae bacterium]